jgi:glycine cleavage system T protein
MPLRSPLHERERALGASFGAEWPARDDGFEVALHFGDPAAEHRAVRAAAGLFDTTYVGLVEVSGPHRVRFLNGQVTNDLRALVDGQGVYAATLTPTGKMAADLRIYVVGETFLLATPPLMARAVIEHLDHFRVADRVAFTDLSARVGSLLLQGPASAAALEAALGGPLPPPVPLANLSRRFEAGGGSVDARVCRYGATGEDGFELLCPVERLAALYDRLLEAGRPHGLVPAGLAALASLRVEAGIPFFGVDMDASTNPLEARLSHAVSLQKGCYTGQEVIAKATYVGQVNRLLVGLEFPEGAEGVVPGATVRFSERDAGRVTSVAFGPSLDRTVALGMVRREAAEPGTRLAVATRGEAADRPAVVAPLPFYSR